MRKTFELSTFFVIAFLFFISSKAIAQCTAVAGTLGGSGIFCINEGLDIGVSKTKKDQTYTWYLNKTTKVQGPVTGNGGAISFEAPMSKSLVGKYTVVAEKAGCNSKRFGNVEVEYRMPPDSLMITSVIFDSVAFKWKKSVNAFGYEYAVDQDSANPSSGTFTFDSTGSANFLKSFTDYYIHVRCYSTTGGDCEWTTLKFKTPVDETAGALDVTFNKNGKVITAVGSIAVANALAIQKDGKIVVAGFTQNATYDCLIMRYNANGKTDNTFGTKGKATIDLGNFEKAEAVTIQKDGKILIAGYAGTNDGGDFLLARFKTNGLPDSSFGINGIVVTDIRSHADKATAITVQSTGKIVVTGYTHSETSEDIGLVRYNMNGSIDSSFGTNGKTISSFGTLTTPAAITVQKDNKILVSGYIGINAGDFLTIRYKADGSTDSTFGNNGSVTTDFGVFASAKSVIVLQNQKIIVGGDAIVQYNKNGTVDSSFGSNGIILNALGGSVAVTPSGKIVLAGSYNNGTNNDVAVAMYTSNGGIEESFGTSGVATTDFDLNNDYASAVQVQKDEKIVVAGYTVNNMNKTKLIIARYNGDTAQNFQNKAQNFAVKNSTKQNEIFIAPNPVAQTFTIHGLPAFTQKNIVIKDAEGKTLIVFNSMATMPVCNVSHLHPGIYFACITQNKKTTCIKFIKE